MSKITKKLKPIEVEINVHIEKEIRILKNIHSFLLCTVIVLISGLVAFIIGSQI